MLAYKKNKLISILVLYCKKVYIKYPEKLKKVKAHIMPSNDSQIQQFHHRQFPNDIYCKVKHCSLL